MSQQSTRSYKFFITLIKVHKIHLVFWFFPDTDFSCQESAFKQWKHHVLEGLISLVQFCYFLRSSWSLKDLLCLLEFCVWWKCSSASKSEKCRFQKQLVLSWDRSHAIGLHCSTWDLLICWDQTGVSAHPWNTSHEMPWTENQTRAKLPKRAFPPCL